MSSSTHTSCGSNATHWTIKTLPNSCFEMHAFQQENHIAFKFCASEKMLSIKASVMCKTKQYSQTAAGFYTSCFLQKFYLNGDEKHLFFFLCMKIPTMWDDNKRALFFVYSERKKKNTTYVWTFSRSERGEENQAAGMQSSGKQRTCSQNFMVRWLHRDRDKFRSQPRKPVLPWQRLLLDHQDAILTKQPRLDVHPGE